MSAGRAGSRATRAALVCAVAIMGMSAASAPSRAALPGMNLSWNDCLFTSASPLLSFSCDDNHRTLRMVASFRIDRPLQQYVGASAGIAFVIGSGSLPPWWQLGSGQCREGALAMVPTGSLGGCTDPFSGAAQAGGFVIEPMARPQWFRVRADWYSEGPVPIQAETLYTAMVFELRTDRTIDEGACAGCEVGACMRLSWMDLYALDDGYTIIQILRTDHGSDIFFQPTLYPYLCITPARNSTWGALKALYR